MIQAVKLEKIGQDMQTGKSSSGSVSVFQCLCGNFKCHRNTEIFYQDFITEIKLTHYPQIIIL